MSAGMELEMSVREGFERTRRALQSYRGRAQTDLQKPCDCDNPLDTFKRGFAQGRDYAYDVALSELRFLLELVEGTMDLDRRFRRPTGVRA